jgi:alpha-ketoglutarate-dependent 2,4-dichlorophenoxyacetate dioxygenase
MAIPVIQPLVPGFVASIEGVDVARATDEDLAAVKSALITYPVLVLPCQQITAEEQIAFAGRFGPVDDESSLPGKFRATGSSKEILELSIQERTQDGLVRNKVSFGTTFWHTDGTFKRVPAHLSMLYGLKVTREGGETQFADLRADYDRLPCHLKTLIEKLVAEHCVMRASLLLGHQHTQAELEEGEAVSAYRIVRMLPESGRKTLYLSVHATQILGMPTDEGRVLLSDLTEIATRPDNVYTHRWSQFDFVIWDNRCTNHRLRYYYSSQERLLRRVSTRDEVFPTLPLAELQAQLAV